MLLTHSGSKPSPARQSKRPRPLLALCGVFAGCLPSVAAKAQQASITRGLFFVPRALVKPEAQCQVYMTNLIPGLNCYR